MNYILDVEKGILTPNNQPFMATMAGAGPRHFEYHPNGKFAYVVQELNNTVTAYKYQNGALEALQTLSTLPEGYTEKSFAADIHTSPDGRFLYASNRGHDSIVIYSIDPKTGLLKYIETQSVMGKWPRNFTLDSKGKFLLVANQESDNITVFRRNKKTGKLIFTGKETKISMPVCLKFL